MMLCSINADAAGLKILKTEKWPGRDARSFCAKNHSPGERKKDDVDDEKRKTVAMK